MVKDTVRILVDFYCNYSCTYCCNLLPEVREKIKPIALGDIDFNKYKVVCITGGEPLVFLDRVQAICEASNPDNLRVLYTNGKLLTPKVAKQLVDWGIKAVNVGLHKDMFPTICQTDIAFRGLDVDIRYALQDKYYARHWDILFPEFHFKYWTLNDCERDNEDWFVLQF